MLKERKYEVELLKIRKYVDSAYKELKGPDRSKRIGQEIYLNFAAGVFMKPDDVVLILEEAAIQELELNKNFKALLENISLGYTIANLREVENEGVTNY